MNDFNNDLEVAIKKVILSMQALLGKTAEKAYGQPFDLTKKPTFKDRELCLIESRYELLLPQGDVRCINL
jgi:hypothetical protein